MSEMPRNLVVAAAQVTGGNLSHLADLIGISRRALAEIKATNGAVGAKGTLWLLAILAANPDPDEAKRLLDQARQILKECGIDDPSAG